MSKSILEFLLPSLLGGGASGIPGAMDSYVNQANGDSIIARLRNGTISAEEALGLIAQGDIKLSPEQESYISSMLSNQRTNEARDYETEMANTDFLRAASQLGALGMSPYNVLQSGASATPNVSAASSPMLNNANQRYNRATSIANSLISMAGRMASSGIYGNAIASVKNSASKAASMAAHSAPAMLNTQESFNMSDNEIDELLESFK